MRLTVGAATIAAALAVPFRRAAAAPSATTAWFAWNRGEGADACPDASGIELAVAAMLGRSPFAPKNAAQLEIAATVMRSVDHLTWHAEVVVRGPGGEDLGRRLIDSDAPSCGPIAEQVAFVLAVTIDPEAALAHQGAPPAGLSAPAAEQTRAPTPPPPPPPRAPQPPWRFAVEAAGAASVGLLPRVGFGGALQGRLGRDP